MSSTIDVNSSWIFSGPPTFFMYFWCWCVLWIYIWAYTVCINCLYTSFKDSFFSNIFSKFISDLLLNKKYVCPLLNLFLPTTSFRMLGCCTYFGTMKDSPWWLNEIQWNFYSMLPLILRLNNVNIKKHCLVFLFRFLYARLQTGRIMVWWCPSVRPSGSPSIRPSVRPSVTVFRTFLLHALRYWAEILYIT